MTDERAPGDFRVLLLSPALVEEPLGLMYIAGALRKAGYAVRGVLFNRSGRGAESLEAAVLDWDPDVVAFGVITGEHRQCLEVSRHLRSVHRHFTVLGGPYLTFAPETLLDEQHVDAVGRGECESAMVSLCDHLRTGADHREVPNFWFRIDGQVVRNPLRPLDPIDELAPPDREVFGSERADGTFNLMSSRGCPYKCTYCFNDRFVELYRPTSKGGGRIGDAPSGVVRNRAVACVVAEMRSLVERHHVEQFNFHDDIFPLRASRTIEFCEAYESSGIGIPWSCSVKAELLDEGLVAAMARAGCNKVYMGVEAAEDGVRNDLLLRRVGRASMVDAAAMVREAGIQLFTQSMVGLPGTSLDADFETMRFNAELRPAFAWVSIFTPYPGTALADRAHVMGLVDPDFMATMPSSYHYRSILRVPHADGISNLHKVFSLGVDRPELVPALQDLVARAGHDDVDALHRFVFLPFREWKHDLLRRPDLEAPPELVATVDALRAGDVDALLTMARRHVPQVEAGAGGPRGWVSRDGVDVLVGPASSDRHAAQP